LGCYIINVNFILLDLIAIQINSIDELLDGHKKRMGVGVERKKNEAQSNITDNESTKMTRQKVLCMDIAANRLLIKSIRL